MAPGDSQAPRCQPAHRLASVQALALRAYRQAMTVEVEVKVRVDGTEHRLTVDTGTPVLDALRERPGITSPRKRCHVAHEPWRATSAEEVR